MLQDDILKLVDEFENSHAQNSIRDDYGQEYDHAMCRAAEKLRELLRECDCAASGNANKPKQHGADPHAKNCAIYIRR